MAPNKNSSKYINKRNIINCLRKNEDHYYSRAYLAKALELSKPTVSILVEELISEGWIKEKQGGNSTPLGGRKPIHLEFNAKVKYLIGVDIGGTNTEVGIFDLNGEILSKDKILTQNELEIDFISRLVNLIKNLLNSHDLEGENIYGMGIGVPGITDKDKGIVQDAPSLGWKNYHLKEKLETFFSFPIYIDNDVNVALMGEKWKGKFKNKNNGVLLTLGTGIGCGIMIHGQIYHGTNFAAGEVGFMITDQNPDQTVGTVYEGYGFLDNQVGGPALLKKYNQKVMLQNKSNTGECLKEAASPEEIFDLAFQGSTIALEMVNGYINHLSIAILNIVTLLNPEVVIIGGGISGSIKKYIPGIETYINGKLPVKTHIECTLISYVSILGAASLCLKNDELFVQV